MRLYDKLVQRKRNGQHLVMKQVTYELLHQLWWTEDCSDGAIAELFDVPKKKITNLRHKWGIKVPDIIVNAFEKRIEGTVPIAEEDAVSNAISADSAVLLRKIIDLNDTELESLRVELARRFVAFADVKQENDFLIAVERAIREFGSKEGS